MHSIENPHSPEDTEGLDEVDSLQLLKNAFEKAGLHPTLTELDDHSVLVDLTGEAPVDPTLPS